MIITAAVAMSGMARDMDRARDHARSGRFDVRLYIRGGQRESGVRHPGVHVLHHAVDGSA